MDQPSRLRMQAAFNYTEPDKIPLVYHPSPAGLFVHGEKLLELFNQYPSDNPIVFDKVPVVGPECYDSNGDYHELIKDDWGTVWEYRIFGIAGHPKSYPISSWDEALEKLVFPPIADVGSRVFNRDKQMGEENKSKYFVFNGWISLFEKICGFRPFDEVLMDLYSNNKALLAFLDKLTEYWLSVIDYYAEIGTDVYVFGDDWGMQNATIVDPVMFKEIYKPLYKKLFDRVKFYGGLPFLHCCGYMGKILDEFIDLGVRGLWPQLNLYYSDQEFIEKCRENRIAIYLHPDRQRLVPLGSPREIEKYICGLAERYHRMGGGGIFYVEIENDAPFENVKALFRSIDKYR